MILLLGSGGQLGQELSGLAERRGLALAGRTRAEVDIANRTGVEKTLEALRPSLVVNAGAYTKVDRAEAEEDEAFRANAAGPEILALACACAGLPLIHISTDYVFDGTKPSAYRESDPVAPLGVYGRSKAAGEEAVRRHLPRHVILRTAWVYGPYGANFLKTMLRLAAERDELRVVADQRGCPTSTADLAEAILAAARRIAANDDAYGTYHFAGTGATTWHGFASRIVEVQARHTGRRPRVVPIRTEEYPTPASRPANSELDSSLFARTFGYAARPWAEAAEATVEHLINPSSPGPDGQGRAESVMNRKGIILAGGSGSRLHPLTLGTSKQMLPIYDKPMIYYPLTSLMLAGIKDILIITTPTDQEAFRRLLGTGQQWGVRLDYAVQPSPDGLAQAFIIAEDFLQGDPSCLVLGDNLIYGHGLSDALQRASEQQDGATVFGYRVEDPERYGIVAFDDEGRVTSIEEKPSAPKSPWAVIGLYFYDGQAVDIAKHLKPSVRGELEITDLNNVYLERQQLYVEQLGRGYTWLDAGTHESLLEAAEFVHVLQSRQGQLIASPEEIAYRQGWIDRDAFKEAALKFSKTRYGRLLLAQLQSHEL